MARRNSDGLAALLRHAAAAPILHCCLLDTTESEGMTQVLISRQLSDGTVAFAMFLLDTFCLGVKDAVGGVASRGRYDEEIYGELRRRYDLVELAPESARKLIEDAVDYARDLGFSPHADYRKARAIFGDIDAAASAEEFVFGRNGKPLFVAGPHDDPARCRQIINTLERRCGSRGYHFIVPVDFEADRPVPMNHLSDAENEEL